MITQLRVVNVLKKWIENHYYFFDTDEKLREAFSRFMEEMAGQSTQQKEVSPLKQTLTMDIKLLLTVLHSGRPCCENRFKRNQKRSRQQW